MTPWQNREGGAVGQGACRRVRSRRCGRLRCAAEAIPRGRHSRQQSRHLRAEGIFRHRGCRLDQDVRSQRDERGAADAALSEADAGQQGLGPRRVRLQRVRCLHPERDGALRFLEVGAARDRARRGGDDQGHQRHRQFGDAGSDLGRDGAGSPRRARRGGWHHRRRSGPAHLHRTPPGVAAAALRAAGRSRQSDLLCLLKGLQRHQRRALRVDGGIVTNPF